MALLTRSQFDTLYNSSGSGTFLDNSTQSIVEASMRQFAKDIEDSVVFIGDNYNTDILFFYQDDFLQPVTNFSTGFGGAGASGGIGTTYGSNSTYHAVGEIGQTTGTTNAGVASLHKGGGVLLIGNGSTITYNVRFAIQQLSTGTQTFTSTLGFGDSPVVSDQVNGCYFRYTDGVNSGKWQAVTANASTRTSTDTGITASAGYHIFTIVIDSTVANVKFYIDNVLVATNTTNLPPSTAIYYNYHTIQKSVGTTACIQSEDWYSLLFTRSTSR